MPSDQPTHLPSAEQRARTTLERRKEEQRLEKLKIVLLEKLKATGQSLENSRLGGAQ
jgi:hypothetical protein